MMLLFLKHVLLLNNLLKTVTKEDVKRVFLHFTYLRYSIYLGNHNIKQIYDLCENTNIVQFICCVNKEINLKTFFK